MRIFLRMHIIGLLFLSCWVGNSLQAQTGKDRAATLESIYQRALSYNDLNTATYATHELISMGESYKNWRDTLLALYFRQEMYLPAIRVAEELSAEQPSNQGLLEIQAAAWRRLGGVKQSLQLYERLYQQTQDIFSLYQIAILQYRLGRVKECEATLNEATTHPKFEEAEISVNGPEGGLQTIPIKAAVFNVQGLLAMTLNKYDMADELFVKALEVAPDFELAMANRDLNKENREKAEAEED